MSRDELREAVEYYDKAIRDKSLKPSNIHLAVLLCLASAVLEKMPQKIEGDSKKQSFGYMQKVAGYNQALSDVREALGVE